MIEQISKLVRGESLTETEASAAMEKIMSGDATPAQIAGFVVALRIKGESADELTGLARAARANATPIDAGEGLLDTCGTGGDGTGTFNISTLAAIGFLFAPVFHPSLRYATGPRRELGVRTVFNILGPLCNPAGASRQALGVADGALAATMAEVLARLGVERALVFHAEDGMDELSTVAPSTVIEINAGERREYRLDPGELGLRAASAADVRGGDAAENAAIARDVLSGAGGPRRDIVLLNAAAALRVAGLAGDWQEGMAAAAEAIDSGKAAATLERWVAVSQAVAVA